MTRILIRVLRLTAMNKANLEVIDFQIARHGPWLEPAPLSVCERVLLGGKDQCLCCYRNKLLSHFICKGQLVLYISIQYIGLTIFLPRKIPPALHYLLAIYMRALDNAA